MGPFVPDVITDELNLIVGFIVGIAFGFVLEQAGFSSSRKLTGLFYGTDFTVLRVFFSAGVTAMCGVALLSNLGLLDTQIIFINPTFLYAALVGGGIMGVGFVVGGFCPGTAFCGTAIGKIDAMFFVLGGVLGVFVFGEFYPTFEGIYTAKNFGDPTLPSLFGVSTGIVALGVTLVAVGAFIATGKIERIINPAGPASSFPYKLHRIAAGVAIAVAALLAVTPDRQTRLFAEADDPNIQAQANVATMTADELAYRILDNDPRLQLIDVRSAEEFTKTGLPGAVNMIPGDMLGRSYHDLLGRTGKQKVFFAEDEATGRKAATLARLLGYEDIAVLEGGLAGFRQTILEAPEAPAATEKPTLKLAVVDQTQVTARFRARASKEMASLISNRGKTAPAVKRVKKIVGGCGV
jgi:rhodanese-related sulfurtransferase